MAMPARGPVDVDATGPATDLVEHHARVHGVGGERAAQLGRPLSAAAPREAEVAWPRGAAIVAHGGEHSRAGAGEPVERERARVRPSVRAERRPEERPQLEPAHLRRLGADEHRGGRQVVAYGALRGEAPLRPPLTHLIRREEHRRQRSADGEPGDRLPAAARDGGPQCLSHLIEAQRVCRSKVPRCGRCRGAETMQGAPAHGEYPMGHSPMALQRAAEQAPSRRVADMGR